MIIGAASGLSAEAVTPWAASARKVWDGMIVLLTDQPTSYDLIADRYRLTLRYARLRPKGAGVCAIARARWRELRNYLWDRFPPDLPVAFVDVRDAIFQTNPLTRINGKLLLGTEGKTHAENAWCLGWVQELAPEWVDRLKDADVLNAGCLAGPRQLLRDFARELVDVIPDTPCTCTEGAQHMTDQTWVNILARRDWAPHVEITDDWVFHVRSMDHERIPAVWQETRQQLLRADGEPFPIVHQYDLSPQLAPLAEIR